MSKRPSKPRNHSPAGAAFTTLVLDTFRFNGRLLQVGDRLIGDLGISSARWQVMGAVENAGGPVIVSEIARIMGLRRQSVQRLVDEMAADGLLKLSDNPNHRRAKLVSMTAAGWKLKVKLDERQGDWANAVAKGIKAADLDRASALIRHLYQRLGDSGGD
jgi:DNA-binding MarR family transcriptional regulator